MGWIKARLSEDTHDQLRDRVEDSDKPTHDIAAELIESAINHRLANAKPVEQPNE